MLLCYSALFDGSSLRAICEDGDYWSARVHRTILTMNCLRNLPTRTPANFTSLPSSAASYQPVQKVLHVFSVTITILTTALCADWSTYMCGFSGAEFLGFACRRNPPSHTYQPMTPVRAGRIKVTPLVGGSSLVQDVCCPGR